MSLHSGVGRAKKNSLVLDERERDTIMAALRLWQRASAYLDTSEETLIADNGRQGPKARLNNNEIDDLILGRLNT